MNQHSKWLLLTFVTSLSIYWTVNLLLWFPWSISTALGVTLMLTVAPFFWTYGILKCLKTADAGRRRKAAIIVSLIYLLVPAITDFLFYGMLRNAMTELYQPTTFYGYAFLFSLPFILLLCFAGKMRPEKAITKIDFLSFAVPGLLSAAALAAIITFDIKL